MCAADIGLLALKRSIPLMNRPRRWAHLSLSMRLGTELTLHVLLVKLSSTPDG
jgi:hypothetical protein